MRIKEKHVVDQESLDELFTGYPFKPYSHYEVLGPESLVRYLKDTLTRNQTWFSYDDSRIIGLGAFRELPWDSRFLGFKAGRIELLIGKGDYDEQYRIKENLLGEILDHSSKKRISYVICRVQSNDLSSLHLLEKQGFITLDGILTFSCDVRCYEMPKLQSDYRLRLAEVSDIAQVREIACSAFVFDRFHSDPLISKQTADEIKATWVENACRGAAADAVVVAEKGESILGFITCKIHHSVRKTLGIGIGSFDLVAVAPRARGQGVASRISLASLAWFKENNIDFVEVGTQFRNIAATGVYQKAKFKLVSSSITLRKWLV